MMQATASAPAPAAPREIIHVEDLSLGYGETVIMEHVSFSVAEAEIVSVLGGSGCGKSTLLKGLIGLLKPVQGSITLNGDVVTGTSSEEALARARRHMGVLFQGGALLGSLTVAENVALPLQEFTDLPPAIVQDIVEFTLSRVGLADFTDYMPADISGGMKKRAGLARALVLDPAILFCDEPSAGLDPITSLEIDELLLDLNRSLGITMLVVTHELASIEHISHRCIMLDREARGIIAIGTPADLKDHSTDPKVQAFFRRRLPAPEPQGGTTP